MTDREILEELLAAKRREDTIRYIHYGAQAAIAIVIAVLLCIYLPPVIAYFHKVSDTIEQI